MGPVTVSTPAKQVGLRADTIRSYQRAGLLPPPLRSPAGSRQDDQTTVDRVRVIRGAQRLGLRLGQLADLLAVRDKGACPCGHAQALVGQRISELDAEIARLADVRGDLTRLAADCAAGACRDGVWPCQAGFIQAGKEVTTT